MKNKWLIILLAVMTFKGLIWIALIPPFQVPDENIHFAMIQYLGENHHFPGKTNPAVNSSELIAVTRILNFPWLAQHPVWRGIPGNWREQILGLPAGLKSEFAFQPDTEGGQKLPQGYYWMNYPVYLIFSQSNFLIRFYSLRLISLFLGLGTIYLAYLVGGLTVATWVGFQPMASVIFSGVTYDSLAVFAASLFIYLGQTKKTWATLMVAVAGVFIKGSLLALLLAWPLLLRKRQLWLWLPLTGALSWLIYRSLPGSFTITPATAGAYLSQYWHSFSAEIFPWYWGVFGWLEKTMSVWVYRALKILVVLSLLGWVKVKFKPWPVWLTTMLVAVVMVVFGNDFFFFARNASNFGVQGRYFLPAIIPITVLFISGLRQFIPAKILVIMAVALNLIGLFTAYQYFGWIWAN